MCAGGTSRRTRRRGRRRVAPGARGRLAEIARGRIVDVATMGAADHAVALISVDGRAALVALLVGIAAGRLAGAAALSAWRAAIVGASRRAGGRRAAHLVEVHGRLLIGRWWEVPRPEGVAWSARPSRPSLNVLLDLGAEVGDGQAAGRDVAAPPAGRRRTPAAGTAGLEDEVVHARPTAATCAALGCRPLGAARGPRITGSV